MGVLGGQKCKSQENLPSGCTDWHQICYMSADSSGNGHRLKTISPSIFRGAFWGVLGVTKCKSLENLPNGWTDWHQIWYTSADSSRNGHRLKTITSADSSGNGRRLKTISSSQGGILGGGGLGVKNSKVWKIYQTVGPIGTKFGTHLQIHMGMDIG